MNPSLSFALLQMASQVQRPLPEADFSQEGQGFFCQGFRHDQVSPGFRHDQVSQGQVLIKGGG